MTLAHRAGGPHPVAEAGGAGQPLGAPLTGHTDTVRDVAFSPDGRQLATAGDDKTVRIWPAIATPEMVCDKLSANISRHQWNDWVSGHR